jgi:putative peptide zinc metalloprotease protein
MSATCHPLSAAGLSSPPASTSDLTVPRLLGDTELLGQAVGSGLKQAPYLIRRCDGQVVQLSRLLYEFACRMDGRELAAIARGVGDALEVRVTAEQVGYVAEHTFAPLGLVCYRDGHTAPFRSRNALLALRYRVGLLSGAVVDRLAGPLQVLFFGPVVVVAVAALVGLDVWLGVSGHVGGGLGVIARDPGLVLALFGVTVGSLAFHEFGHAAACRYGGARPGRVGAGLYLIWPVFFSDVTDSYRLARGGRLRTDLGGVYFNALVAVAAGVGYVVGRYPLLLVVAVTQQLLIVDQFMPWVRLDGYHVVSDLIGVPDLFARIGPILAGLKPGARADRRVTELKWGARVAVTAWVVTAITALAGIGVLLVANSSRFVEGNWAALITQLRAVGAAVHAGDVLVAVDAVVGFCMLTLPVAGVLVTYLLLCRGLGGSLAVRRGRRELTRAGVGDQRAGGEDVSARGGLGRRDRSSRELAGT